jgi:DNA-binding XRE family transcriptional regulator
MVGRPKANRESNPVRTFLDEMGRSQAWLSEKTGAGRTTVHSWYHGITAPSPEYRAKIAPLFGMPVEQMFGGAGGGYEEAQARVIQKQPADRELVLDTQVPRRERLEWAQRETEHRVERAKQHAKLSAALSKGSATLSMVVETQLIPLADALERGPQSVRNAWADALRNSTPPPGGGPPLHRHDG